MNYKIVGAYTFNCLIWSTTWVVIKLGYYEGLTPLLFIAARFLVACLSLALVLKVSKTGFSISWNEFKHSVVLGLFMFAIPYAIVFTGIQYTNSAMGAVLMCCVPLFVFPVSYLMGRVEATTLRKIFGVVMGLVGVIVVFYPKLSLNSIGGLKGEALLLLAALIYAFAGVYLKKYENETSIRKGLFYQLLIAFVCIFALGSIVEDLPLFVDRLKSVKAISIILYLALFGTAANFLLYYWLIKKIGVVASTVAAYIEVVMALFLDYFIMDVVPHVIAYPGILLIFLGVWLVVIKKMPYRIGEMCLRGK